MDASEEEGPAGNGSANTAGTEEHWTIPSSTSISRYSHNAQAGPSAQPTQRPGLGKFRISYESSYIPFITGGEGADQGEKVMQQSVRGFEVQNGQGNADRSDDDEDSSDENMDADSEPLLPPIKSTSTFKSKTSHSISSALPSPQFISGKFIFNPPAPPPTSKPSGSSAQRPNGITAIDDDDDKPVEVRRNRKGQPLPMADARRKGPPNRTPGRFDGVKNLPPGPSEEVKRESGDAMGSGSGKGGFRKPAGFEDIPSRSTSASKSQKRKLSQPDSHSSEADSSDNDLATGARASKKPKMAEKETGKAKAKKQRQKEKKREKVRQRADEDEDEEESDPTDRMIDEFVRRLDEE